jgi:integrase
LRSRRTRGEGSVFFSRSEKTWIAEITLPDGSRKRKRSKDKQVVTQWLFEQRKVVSERGSLPDDKVTFAQFADRFMEDVAKHTLKEKTYITYESYLKLHLLPDLGNQKLNAITAQQIQRLYTRKLNAGLSKKTVHHIHSTLRRVLNEAVKWELIHRNPCDSVTPPRVIQRPPTVWSIEQAQTFLRATAEHKWHAIYLIALSTGARRGEILGMEWQNLNWTRSTITIEKTISEIKGRAVVTSPKTKTSRRVIVLPKVVIDLLKENKKSSGFIFQSEALTPISPRNLLRDFYSILATLDIPKIRFHDLRHTAATILLTKDVHPKKVQELLGHASIVQTLDVYSHYIQGADTQTAKEMDLIFGP